MSPAANYQKAIASLPLIQELGMSFEHISEGVCRCSLPITPRLVTPHGSLHGGMTFTLADTGMGFAIFSVLEPDERATTISMSIRYLKPAKRGSITAHCRVVQRGSSIASTQAEIFDNEGDMVALADGSFYIWRRKDRRE